jgi:hypothetical protein
MIKIYDAANLAEANIVCGLLQAHGIDAHVSGHYLQGGIGELPPMGFHGVLVPEGDESRARAVIKDYEAGAFALPDEDSFEA